MDNDMLIFMFVVPVLVLFTIIGGWAYLSARADDKEIHQLASAAKRNGVKPLDDY